MSARSVLAAHLNGKPVQAPAAPRAFAVTVDAKGKLILPELPAASDRPALCQWLTVVFNLDARHPITGGERQGLRGPDGHVVLNRAGAPSLRFEPASRINQPPRLIETITWQSLQSDGPVHALKAEHCRQIAHAVKTLCDAARTLGERDEAAGIVGTFLGGAEAMEDYTTYGTTAQRYEAASVLQRVLDDTTGRPLGPPRYLLDANTGEMVIRVSDLADAARRHVGATLPRGWLDGRMAALGWARVELQGYAQAGRDGRRGPHARVYVYRGLLPAIPDEEQAGDGEHVNTPKHTPTHESEGLRSHAHDKRVSCVHVFTPADSADDETSAGNASEPQTEPHVPEQEDAA